MKKVIILSIILIFGFSTMALAAATFDKDGNSSATGVLGNFKTSNNVEVHVASSAQSYAATSGHLNGDRAFGTASDDPKIYYQSKDKGTAVSDPGGSDSSIFSSGWDPL